MLHVAALLALASALVGTFPILVLALPVFLVLGLVALPPVPALLTLPAIGLGLLRARRVRARVR